MLMRRLFPLIVILAASLLYLKRETILHPFQQIEHSGRVASKKYTATALDTTYIDRSQITVQAVLDTLSPPIVTHGSIRPGSSFFIEMRSVGFLPTEIDRIVRASRKMFNLKKVHPGQKYAIYKTPGGSLDSLALSLRGDRLLKVRRDGDQFHAVIDTLPYVLTYHVTSGTIGQSLFVSLQSEGADPELATHLAHIFGWEIDFFTDIRMGDHYAILYEKKSYENGRSILGRILSARIFTRGKEYYAFGYEAPNRPRSYYDLHGKSLQKSLLRAPLSYSRIASNFSWKRLHPITRHYAPHLGVDYAAPYGTPVKATGDGVVVAATRGRANGKYIKIRHNRSYTTYYLHLSRFAKGIRKGKSVRQGQVIGYVGSTGLAKGPHLDYRIKVNGRFVNPRTINLPSKDPIRKRDMVSFGRIRDACLVKLYEGTLDGDRAKTIMVSEPTIYYEDQLPALF
ncbi:MAG: peptidoglycan DD-metalloendopeptidase family protein [Candidatus Latescibacteria bacterium]|nr:peptidoglycan DD-metalloendopeptidase family protein [Candidatus Latescibacterota bacterium]NIM22286.1 peptidoglycan DD-metalloendopeptidase family protein [Candidatus Latescibacterota bacterium]NIM65765.1 peptidoglycan DD-metalloendopeptidase family protein [Candidatus Latescibacterota bacterium]NIO02150.1 peptidoglycan DD-metalloendopeptidase family protein [Candidatus Latescibacterota bacterium]NIO28982.1 peptidoglycan DD-metalloendopeptidase family protein [Candidatus Latescibacterota ba